MAARSCVGEHGLSGASSRRIADAAGANLGAITYYFGSKDELVAEALFTELSNRLQPVLDLLKDSERSGPDRLVTAVQQLVAEFEQSPDDVPVYLNALMAGTEPGPFAARANELVVEVRSELARAIELLRSAGTIASWVDPEAMSALLISTANGVALQSRLDARGPAVSAMAGQLASLLLAAGSSTV